MSAGEAHGSIFVSVVSHHQAELVGSLLTDLVACPEVAHVVLTYNVPESETAVPSGLADRLSVVRNQTPRGFAANHNAAFRRCALPFFCVLNPDIRLPTNPFPRLLPAFTDSNVGLVAPAVVNPAGEVEDSARRYPTPIGLVRKALGGDDGRYAFRLGDGAPLVPDWIAGMFLLLRTAAFADVHGFDEAYYLYYEDIDLCIRLRQAGREILLYPNISVVHDSRRMSHRNLRYFSWHLASIIRYFRKHLGRLPGRT